MARYPQGPVRLALLLLTLGGCASDSVTVTGTVRPPLTPEHVTIYLHAPADFEVIALMSASSDTELTAQGALTNATGKLKEQAAKLGANGVLLGATFDTISASARSGEGLFFGLPVRGKLVEGKAIFVKKK